MQWPSWLSRAPRPETPPQLASWIHRQQRPPTRDQAAVLAAFAKNPRLFSVASRVADGVAAQEWCAYRVGTPDQARAVYRDLRSSDERGRREIKQDLGAPVANSQALALWNRGSPDMTAHQIRRTIQIHLDLAGESFSLLELNGLGVPGFLYPLNPTWVQTPAGRAAVGGQRQYLVNGGGFASVNYTSDRILQIRHPDPNDPYGRGVGVGTALGNEIDVDEYAAQTAAAKFYNHGTPDWLIKLEGLGKSEIETFRQQFVDLFRGHRKTGQPHFTNAKNLEAIKLDTSFVDLDLIEMRRFAAEVIRESFGVPPEIMGNVTNSNRATISSAYYLFATLCLVPRLRMMEDAINQCLIPMFDETNIVITYESPVPADREAEQEVVLALPTAFEINKIRSLGGAEPIDDGDDLYSDGSEMPESEMDEEAEETEETEETETDAPAADAPANEAAPAASQLSLNGAQVASAKEIVLDVAYGRLPRETGLAMLEAFFGLTPEQSEQIMGAVGKTFKPAPEDGPAAESADAPA